MIPIASPDIGAEERGRVADVLADGQLADGPEVRRFESEFADYCGTDFAVATNNGTSALHTALHAVGVGEGDTVITTPLSFVATANAIRHAGAEPVFADVDPITLTLDPYEVSEILDERDDVAAILVVHLYGLPAEMDFFSELAERHDVALVEDAAQAHGAEYRGQRVGAIGDAGCFSFYPTKNMTTGEGGMVTTDDEAVADRAAAFVDHCRSDAYTHDGVGYNYRMTSLSAAIGRAQLAKLPDYNVARRGHASYLSKRLRGTPIRAPLVPLGRQHVFHQFTVRCDERDELAKHLSEAGVDSSVYYPKPIHEQPAYAGVDADLPVAERAAEHVLSLPVHPDLSTADLRRVGDEACAFAETLKPTDDNRSLQEGRLD